MASVSRCPLESRVAGIQEEGVAERPWGPRCGKRVWPKATLAPGVLSRGLTILRQGTCRGQAQLPLTVHS